MLEPQQGGDYEQFLTMARTAEAAGFDGLFRSDHLLFIGGPGPPRDALEAWTTLAALARDTNKLRLGTLVSPMTFRHPAVLARCAVTVDQLSNGRAELGLGAGWYEGEHTAYGIPLPPIAERMAMLEEGARVVRTLLDGGPATFHGEYFRLEDAVARPLPVQSKLPIIVGGQGKGRSARLGVELADEYNTPANTPEQVAEVVSRVRAACESAGRPPATLPVTWMGTCIVAGDDEELHRRAADYMAMMGRTGEDGAAAAAELRPRGIVGTYAEAQERMAAYVAAGAERLYLRVLNLEEPEMLLEIADEVAAPVVA
jgi:F420-dependent oxidoreductase-like protein